MDYVDQRRFADLLRKLDRACQRRDRIAADYIITQLNAILAGPEPPEIPGQPKPIEIPAGVPSWLRSIIESQGVRVRHLEKAFDMQKVVVAPMFGGTWGLQIKAAW